MLQEPLQIPQMGFSDHTIHNVSLIPDSYTNKKVEKEVSEVDGKDSEETFRKNLSDQEILDSTEAIYFSENVNMELYHLKRLTENEEKSFDVDEIEKKITILKEQHRVISKKVLQLILEKKNDCNLVMNANQP